MFSNSPWLVLAVLLHLLLLLILLLLLLLLLLTRTAARQNQTDEVPKDSPEWTGTDWHGTGKDRN